MIDTDDNGDIADEGLAELHRMLGEAPPVSAADDSGGMFDFDDRAAADSAAGTQSGPLRLPLATQTSLTWERWRWPAFAFVMIVAIANIARVLSPVLREPSPVRPVVASVTAPRTPPAPPTAPTVFEPPQRPPGTVSPPAGQPPGTWPQSMWREAIPIAPGTPGYSPPTTTTTAPSTTTSRPFA